MQWDAGPQDEAISPIPQQGCRSRGEKSVGGADIFQLMRRNIAYGRDQVSSGVQLSAQSGRVFQRKWDVAITVDSDLMTALMNFFYEPGIILRILADEKERRTDTVLCEHIQYLRRVAQMRTVVEGQRDLAARLVTMK